MKGTKGQLKKFNTNGTPIKVGGIKSAAKVNNPIFSGGNFIGHTGRHAIAYHAVEWPHLEPSGSGVSG